MKALYYRYLFENVENGMIQAVSIMRRMTAV